MDPLKKLNELAQRIHRLTNEARQAADERERLTKMVECQTEDQCFWEFDYASTFDKLEIFSVTCTRCGTRVNINQTYKVYEEEE